MRITQKLRTESGTRDYQRAHTEAQKLLAELRGVLAELGELSEPPGGPPSDDEQAMDAESLRRAVAEDLAEMRQILDRWTEPARVKDTT